MRFCGAPVELQRRSARLDLQKKASERRAPRLARGDSKRHMMTSITAEHCLKHVRLSDKRRFGVYLTSADAQLFIDLRGTRKRQERN
jgi:hypothetical protein